MTKHRLISLFDMSGIMGQPWANNGHLVFNVDLLNRERKKNNQWFINYDLSLSSAKDFIKNLEPTIITSFPPCTDLAVSGAAHFKKKLEKDPLVHVKAIELFRLAEDIAKELNIPCFTENPVSLAATLYRKPDAYFHPYEFGGYLNEDDVHPLYPTYIKARDAYPKKTGAWLLNNATLGIKKPVAVDKGYSLQHTKLGGKSLKTKIIRSLTPRGFALSFYEANSKNLYNKFNQE